LKHSPCRNIIGGFFFQILYKKMESGRLSCPQQEAARKIQNKEKRLTLNLLILYQRVFIEGQAFSRLHVFAPRPPRPLPPLPSVGSTGGATHRNYEKGRQLADWTEGWHDGGAKSYDGEKAWSSINHSIFFALYL
jgi:hypothetical protein